MSSITARSYASRRHYELPLYDIDQLHSDISTINTTRSHHQHKDYLTLNVEELERYQIRPTTTPAFAVNRLSSLSSKDQHFHKNAESIIKLKRQNDRLKNSTRGQLDSMIKCSAKSRTKRHSFISFANPAFPKPCATRRRPSSKKVEPSNKSLVFSSEHGRGTVNSGKQKFIKTVMMLEGLQKVIRGETSWQDHQQVVVSQLQRKSVELQEKEQEIQEVNWQLRDLAKETYDQKLNLSKPSRGLMEEIDSYRRCRLSRAKKRFGLLKKRRMESRQVEEGEQEESEYEEREWKQSQEKRRSNDSHLSRSRNSFYTLRKEIENEKQEDQKKTQQQQLNPYATIGSYALFSAIQGHYHTLTNLIRQAPKCLRSFNDRQQTPLIVAVLGGQPDIVKSLLNFWTNKNHADDHGKTALYYALKNCQTSIVQMLLQAKVSPWSTNECQLQSTDSWCRQMLSNARKVHLGVLLKPILQRVALWKERKHKISSANYFDEYLS